MTTSERAVRIWALKTRQATAMRNVAIRQMHKDGATLRAIGALAGMSHTAIGKIVRGEKGGSDE